MFCKHNWKLLKETMTPSRLALAKDLGVTSVKNLDCALDRKYIQVFTCPKCGKFKRFIEKL